MAPAVRSAERRVEEEAGLGIETHRVARNLGGRSFSGDGG
jgi:hypothetical protein